MASEYGPISRLLHRMALGSPMIAEASHDLELALHGRRAPDVTNGAHVFVSGLARSGTTILMRGLFDTGAFCSLTYRDMPFVLAPNLWSRLGGRMHRAGEASERAHGDRILVDVDSPEALDEVFWRIFRGEAYIQPDRLVPMTADADTIDQFRRYVGLICLRHGRTRYLSKNNNNILRIPTVLSAFPAAIVLMPVRDPVQHALSLLRQHRRFVARHAEDPFSRAYMTWLVHHEFGGDHRPFVWDGGDPAPGDPDTLDYWLRQWIGAHTHLGAVLRAHPDRVMPIVHERLGAAGDTTWSRLLTRLDLRADATPAFSPAPPQDPGPHDPGLAARAQTLYQELADAAFSIS